SGLSRRDRVPAAVLAEVLALDTAPGHPELRAAVTGLPVAGFSGTLGGRFGNGSAAQAAGVIRAKTGTLTGVSSLAGMATDADGRVLVFAFMTEDATDTAAARAGLDRLAAAVAAC